MDKSLVEAKVTQLRLDREAAFADAYRLDGALQILESLLDAWVESDTVVEPQAAE